MVPKQKNKTADSVRAIDPMVTGPYRILKVVKETHDTFTLELAPENKSDACSFHPGQFNMLYVYGVGEVPISISGDPAVPEILVHTTRAVGTVTKSMWKLRTGNFIGVRGPYGTGWPIEESAGRDIVVVAGGIGLAPLRPVIYYILNHREKYGKVAILYGARTPDDIIYAKELRKWRGRFDLDIHITVDRAAGNWRGNVGVVTNLIGRAPYDPFNAMAMVCGPEIMMRFGALALSKRGVDNGKIYVSMERNMKCGIGLCGHCQMGTEFICKDGPVYTYDYIKDYFIKREI